MVFTFNFHFVEVKVKERSEWLAMHAVDETAVDEIAVDETAVDETAVDKPGPNQTVRCRCLLRDIPCSPTLD